MAMTEIGTYTIDPTTGQATFTPTDKSYRAVTQPRCKLKAPNGIKVDTTYTPEIVPVTPTATQQKQKISKVPLQQVNLNSKVETVTVGMALKRLLKSIMKTFQQIRRRLIN